MADYVQPIANGVRTDHPRPNLPFVDDADLPLEDPRGIEQIGRISGSNSWGRCDADERTGEWCAFTTDQRAPEYAWLVQYHPQHGRSVLLYRDRDAASAYDRWWTDRPLLQRAGGYWWTGTTWYRPSQLRDEAEERRVRRRVPHPTTVTAADLLDASSTASWGREYKVASFEPFEVPDEQWRNDLAHWAQQRSTGPEALPLQRCVVQLKAPELSELVSFDEIAGQTGYAVADLQHDFKHGFGEALPAPQALVEGRPHWSRPVVADWQEVLRRDRPETILTGRDTGGSPAVNALWSRMTRTFSDDDKDHTGTGRGVLARVLSAVATPTAVRDVERQAWIGALQAENMLPPLEPTLHVLADGVVREFASASEPAEGIPDLAVSPHVGQILSWFIWHMPRHTPALFGTIIREAERTGVTSRERAVATLREVVREFFDGNVDEATLLAYVDTCLPPAWSE